MFLKNETTRGISTISSQVVCHYTTLNQELTLSAHDIPETDDQEFHLDIVSDNETATSEDDVINYCFFTA